MNNPTDPLPGINQAIETAYGSLAEPTYFFTQAASQGRPYAGFLAGVAAIPASHLDDTDLNDDVAFGFRVTDGKETVFVQLSMVARYAVLLRVINALTVELVEPDAVPPFPLVRAVTRLLARENVRLLGRPTLEAKTFLKLDGPDGPPANVYRALFTNRDTFPWAT